MIKIENTKVVGWENTVRGMRNPMKSWDRSDSEHEDGVFVLGKNDRKLMLKLSNAGSVHAKYRRMIVVYVDIRAPLYWWKEFDTYKVGTVANSCSTIHNIREKEFTLKDFSHEHLLDDDICYIHDPNDSYYSIGSLDILENMVKLLNKARRLYLDTEDKCYWWQIIQLLPSSYNQRRTVMLNYEVLSNIYTYRRNHKLDEWQNLCKWIEGLPYSEIITCNVKGDQG